MRLLCRPLLSGKAAQEQCLRFDGSLALFAIRIDLHCMYPHWLELLFNLLLDGLALTYNKQHYSVSIVLDYSLFYFITMYFYPDWSYGILLQWKHFKPVLLGSVLQRTGVMYRNIFWAPTPRELASKNSTCNSNIQIPVLHHIYPESDLSFVGREDCGHTVCSSTSRSALHSNGSGVRAITFWCRCHWWRCGKAATSSTQSECFGTLDNSIALHFFHKRDNTTISCCFEGREGPLNLLEGLLFRCEFKRSPDALLPPLYSSTGTFILLCS